VHQINREALFNHDLFQPERTARTVRTICVNASRIPAAPMVS